jgi:hypothetical protein
LHFSTDYPFTSAGNASNYLTADSVFRDSGIEDDGLLADLAASTTYAPQDGSWPDIYGTDLGYHYPIPINANDSLGTNFWVGFIFSDSDYGYSPTLSLCISSPVGASGMVIIPGLPGVTANGPVLIVTNCGDMGLNGTYVLTNLTSQEQTDWQDNYLSVSNTAYVLGTNWVGFDDGTWILFGYDTNTGDCNFLYYENGIDLNCNSNEWQPTGEETNSPAPTTMCAQIAAIQTFTVAAGGVTNISIPMAAMMLNYDEIETNGIQVIANAPVSVYGLNYDPATSTAFTAYPVTLLGTNYCVLARPSYTDYNSELVVVATADDTMVTITPTSPYILDGHSSQYSTNLQSGQTYQIDSADEEYDVTGTLVTSDKPIGVFGGTVLAVVPDADFGPANPLVQEQLPIEDWGTNIVSLAFAGRLHGDSYRVLAAYDDTVITITGQVVTVRVEVYDGYGDTTNIFTATNETLTITNQAGQSYDIILDGPVQFQANQPIQVAQFANSSGFDNPPSVAGNEYEADPCEILLPPVGHYLLTNTVFTSTNDNITGDFDENYLNLVVAASGTNSTYLDGSVVAATNFVPIAGSGYYGAQITITNSGAHTVSSSQPVGVQVYGWGLTDAYGYFGGVVK